MIFKIGIVIKKIKLRCACAKKTKAKQIFVIHRN